MPLEIVFLEPQKLASAKTPLLKPYYRLHGFLNNFRIYGTPPSPGDYNDTKTNANVRFSAVSCASGGSLQKGVQVSQGRKGSFCCMKKRAQRTAKLK